MAKNKTFLHMFPRRSRLKKFKKQGGESKCCQNKFEQIQKGEESKYKISFVYEVKRVNKTLQKTT